MSIATRQDVLKRVRNVLASDCSCAAYDFEKDSTTLTLMADRDGRRRYAHRSDPFFVTMGRGVVVTATGGTMHG